MLRIDKNEKKLIRLKPSGLAQAEHWERHLQDMICSDPDAFFREIGEELCLVGQEIRPSDAVPDRIDILALDRAGSTVVLELKRGSHKLQLLQAISYAGMVSRWPSERFVETLSSGSNLSKSDARSRIEDHVGPAAINHTQRILLVAEKFDPAVLTAAEWLYEKFEVDIGCFGLQLSQENGSDYLTCTRIFPPVDIAALTRTGDAKGDQLATTWASWDEALDAVETLAVREFFQAELKKGLEARLSYREVIYRLGGKRRLWVSCRKKYAYVWQLGRFDDDVTYWRDALSEPEYVDPLRNGRALRFRLSTAEDFTAFSKAVHGDLLKAEFSEKEDASISPQDG